MAGRKEGGRRLPAARLHPKAPPTPHEARSTPSPSLSHEEGANGMEGKPSRRGELAQGGALGERGDCGSCPSPHHGGGLAPQVRPHPLHPRVKGAEIASNRLPVSPWGARVATGGPTPQCLPCRAPAAPRCCLGASCLCRPATQTLCPAWVTMGRVCFPESSGERHLGSGGNVGKDKSAQTATSSVHAPQASPRPSPGPAHGQAGPSEAG